MTKLAFLGIDVGTSTTKAVLVSESGKLLGTSLRNYDIETRTSGAAEQDPRTWWDAVVSAVREVKAASEKGYEVRAVGLSGQMHTAVFLGGRGEVLRRAILWADKRATEEAGFISESFGRLGLFRTVKNAVPVGFTAPSILWVKKNEPDVYGQTRKVVQPKDYIRMRLVGALGTDITDASATGLFDIEGRAWAPEVLDALNIPPDILSDVHHSDDVAGVLTDEAVAELSFAASVPVVYGGGDQPVQAVGNGIIRQDSASLTVGTGGQILLPVGKLSDPGNEKGFEIHTFCHCVHDIFYYMGATLAAGLSLKWFRDTLTGGESFRILDQMAAAAPPGSDGLIFLPYLRGERTPHMDAAARGLFYGIDISHGRGHFARAVMEGVAFSLREAYDALGRRADVPDELVLTGGGGKSAVWARIFSDVLGVSLRSPRVDEGSAYGAALLAAVGSGVFRDIDEATKAWVRYRDEVIVPRKEAKKTYDEMYDKYREIYRRLKPDPV